MLISTKQVGNIWKQERNMITLENISKTFNIKERKVEAVKNVSLEIEDHEIYGIIGFSGAGKSTLVRCINLLERPDSGRVIIDQTDYTSLSKRELRHARKNIGMIFQHFNLFRSRTVFENVAYPLKGKGISKLEIRKKVEELLRLVELEEKIDAYPLQLSGGQKQRVAIARALATDPKVLLCDEATSALDPQTTNSILKLLKSLNQKLGITIVLITHEMAVIKEICNKVAVMDNGEVVEIGEVFDVFSNPKQPITQKFIDTTSVLQKVNDLLRENSPVVDIKEGELLVKLKYLERSASEPLISEISRRYRINCNIIFGSIEIIGNAPLGGTVLIISGEKEDIEKALDYLKSRNIMVEVLKHGRNTD